MAKRQAKPPAGRAKATRRTSAKSEKKQKSAKRSGRRRQAPANKPATAAELAARWPILEAVFEALGEGNTLSSHCRERRQEDPTHPAASTIRLWVVRDEPEGCAERYARAREAQAEAWADQCVEISDDDKGDTYEDEKGALRVDYENIQRSRLKVDTRKWIMARLHPKAYGDHLDVTSKGKQLAAPVVQVMRGPDVEGAR